MTMTEENNEVQVPDVKYNNVRDVQYNPEKNMLIVTTNGTISASGGPPEDANTEQLPDDWESNVSNGCVGGVERLQISAFSEDIGEVMIGCKKNYVAEDGHTRVEFSPSSNCMYPNVLFQEKYGNLTAVITQRERL